MAKMPNEGGKKYKGGGSKGKSNTGGCSGPKKQDSQRADVLSTPSHRNPYPSGLS